MTHHQYGVSALVSQMSFHRETSGGVAMCQLFSQACLLQMVGIQITRNEPTLLFRKSRGHRVLGVACLEAHVRAESPSSLPIVHFCFGIILLLPFSLHSNMFLFNLVETSKYLTSFHKPVKMARDLMFSSLLHQTLI